MLPIHKCFLRLYPARHREEFGEEMLSVHQERCAECDALNGYARAAFYMKEVSGLLRGAMLEHLRALSIFNHTFLLSTRRFNMRNGFRFPKSTAVLMTIILAGVILAIHKGEVIATSLAPFDQPVTPIHPGHSYLLPGFVAGFIFFYAAGLIGWVIVYALRRSGVHRLADMSTQSK